jgi:hypothetical protein
VRASHKLTASNCETNGVGDGGATSDGLLLNRYWWTAGPWIRMAPLAGFASALAVLSELLGEAWRKGIHPDEGVALHPGAFSEW